MGPLARDLVHDGPGLRSGRLRREQRIGGRHAAARAHAARPHLPGSSVMPRALRNPGADWCHMMSTLCRLLGSELFVQVRARLEGLEPRPAAEKAVSDPHLTGTWVNGLGPPSTRWPRTGQLGRAIGTRQEHGCCTFVLYVASSSRSQVHRSASRLYPWVALLRLSVVHAALLAPCRGSYLASHDPLVPGSAFLLVAG